MEDREKENVTSYNVGFKRDKTKYKLWQMRTALLR